jgi:hypothetical protein
MIIEEKDLQKLSLGSKSYDYLAASRKLNVVKLFIVGLGVICVDNHYNLTEEETEKYTKELESKHAPLLREIMLPNTLRSPSMATCLSPTPLAQPAQVCDGPPHE